MIDELIEQARLTDGEIHKITGPIFDLSHEQIAQAQLDKAFSLQVSKRDDCPECKGCGITRSKGIFQRWIDCPVCHRTGKQVVTKTIREWLEEALIRIVDY